MNNNEIALNIIKKSKKSLTAYEILDRFQKIKKVQPMTVYRSLNHLINEGIIHKANHNKSYLLCNHFHKEKHNSSIAICKKCGDSEELISDIFLPILKKTRLKKYEFSLFDLEISTICKRCANASFN